MILDQAESFISEYTNSEQFLLLHQSPSLPSSQSTSPPTSLTNSAEGETEKILLAFFHKAKDLGISNMQDLKGKDVENILLNFMPHLATEITTKKALPDLLESFFGFLKDTGRYPPAGAWRYCIEEVRGKYSASLREDGTVKGTTFKKNYTDIGRNDPCPCGSGQKFKKCCMLLIQ